MTTPLLTDGSFWVQLASAELAEFQQMVEQLQRSCQEEPPTPVFFSPGDICAAQFSEDSCWYRARVEGITEGEVGEEGEGGGIKWEGGGLLGGGGIRRGWSYWCGGTMNRSY